MTYCGFIDLLGTKQLASVDTADLNISLVNFHGALGANFRYYEGLCYAASDGAFFENRRLNDYYPYYSRVRNHLYDKGNFFRSSYINGEIQLLETRRNEGDPESHFFSHLYGVDASRAFGEEAKLLGIGCSINLKNDSGKKPIYPKNSFRNVQIKKEGTSYVALPFRDFLFSRFEVSGEEGAHPEFENQHRLLETIFFYCSLASMESDYVAAKYVSLLVNAVRSSSFTDLEVDRKGWVQAPLILRKIVSSRSVIASFTRLPGLKYVLLSIFDEAFKQNGQEIDAEAENEIVGFLAKRRDCQSNLAGVPDFVLSPLARRRLQEKLAEKRGVKKTR